jgi:hypothetical protein
MLRRFAALVLPGLLVASALAAVPEPPPPDAWNVLIRYQIQAFRTERLRQYADMMRAFKDLGFVRDPDEVVEPDEPDNPKATRMRGTVPAKNLERLLSQRAVRSLLVYPRGTKLPEKEARARVEMRLASGYLPETQQKLARRTAEVLAKDAGFVEAVGYDHRGHTRLVGSVPGEHLHKLVEDVRRLPAAQDEGPPLRSVPPVRLTVVRPDWPVPAGRPKLPAVPEKQDKFSPELRAFLADPAAGKRARLEVTLGWTPAETDRTWRRLLEPTGAAVEGRLGPLVTVAGVPKVIAPKLAELPEVVAVRLPRVGRHAPPGPGGEVPAAWEPLRASGLVKIHALGKRGQGTRVAVIADDFSGWERLKGRKDGKTALPDPVLLDLTAERNRTFLPDPMPGAGEGYGTRCARALLRAAPAAELTLIRIDAQAPYMLQTAARAINGEPVRTVALEQRVAELREDRSALERRREQMQEERRVALAYPSDDEEGRKLLDAYRKKQAAFDADAEAYRQRERRYIRLLSDLRRLKGVRLVASTLVWTDGFPVDGSSALSRYFDDRPFKAALWFQAAGDSGSQAWTGLFRDDDGNGVMEFVSLKKPMLPAGSWSPELNFLGWVPARGKPENALPAGARLRLTLQWREAHDPLPLREGEDVYREPLTKLNLVVVYQPDPEGKTRPADDLEVVTGSVGTPVRLNQTLNSATWEHVVEVRVARPGRYAVFVEGKLADGIHAPGEATLPAARRTSEVRPRLFVQTLAGGGRAVWADFKTAAAALGMPADARAVIAVAAADENDRLRPSSAGGPPLGLALAAKPDVLAYDEGGGTAQAASFAAGFAASAWPVGGTLYGVLERLCIKPGDVLRVPAPLRRE